jgi:integrase/recombinase XerD
MSIIANTLSTFPKLVQAFLDMKSTERGFSSLSIQAYTQDMLDYIEYLKENHLSIETINFNELNHYITYLAKKKSLASTTIARRISCLKQFYQFCLRENHLEHNPTLYLNSPKKGRTLPHILTLQNIEKLLSTCNQYQTPYKQRLLALVELTYSTGLRVTELVSLKLNDIRKNEPFIIVKGKGNKERLVPLSEPAFAAIEEYLPYRTHFYDENKQKNNNFLFPSKTGQFYISRIRFFQMLKELGFKAGLDPTHISPHALRHAFATHLLQNGADLRIIQELLGHSDISTTEIYTHITNSELQKMIFEKHPLSKI